MAKRLFNDKKSGTGIHTEYVVADQPAAPVGEPIDVDQPVAPKGEPVAVAASSRESAKQQMPASKNAISRFLGKKAGKWACAAAALLLVVGVGSAFAAGSPSAQQLAAQQAAQTLAATGEKAPQSCAVSVTVEAPDWPADGAAVSVKVTGEKTDKTSYSYAFSAKPNTPKTINIDEGSYEFSVVTEALNVEAAIWECAPQRFTVKAGESAAVTLELVQNVEEAEKAAAEAKAKEEAEAKAKAEAEAKAQAEAEAEAQAQAQREAEAAAAAAAASAAQAQPSQKSVASGTGSGSSGGGGSASAPSGSSGGGTVYIASSGNGSKYHSRQNCSGMKGAIALSVGDAQSRGYTACKNCF